MYRQPEQKRVEILDKMRQIERLRQGIISEQYYGSGFLCLSNTVTHRMPSSESIVPISIR